MADNLKLQNIKDLIANVKDNILGKQHAPNKILSDANDIYIYGRDALVREIIIGKLYK